MLTHFVVTTTPVCLLGGGCVGNIPIQPLRRQRNRVMGTRLYEDFWVPRGGEECRGKTVGRQEGLSGPLLYPELLFCYILYILTFCRRFLTETEFYLTGRKGLSTNKKQVV